MKRELRLTPNVSLLLTYLFTTTVIIVRTWWTMRGGWFVGDEALYILSILESVRWKAFVFVSVRHTIFMWANAIFGWALNLDSIFRVIPFLAIQAFFWNGICTWALYKIVKKLDLKEDSQSFVFLSTSMVAVYVLMNGLYLTEAPSMAFTLLSIYFLLLSVESRTSRDLFLAGVTISLAFLYRDPYLIFILLDALLLLYLVIRKRLRPIHLLLFLIGPLILVGPPLELHGFGVVEAYANVREMGLEFCNNLIAPIRELFPGPPVIFGTLGWTGRLHSIYSSPELELSKSDLALSGDLLIRIRITLLVVWRGLLYGWSIILAPLAVAGLIESIRRWELDDRAKVVATTGLAAFLSLAFIGWFVSPGEYVRGPGAISIAMRFAYTTFPMILGLGVLYERINLDLRKVVTVLGIATLLLIPIVLMKFQSNQSEEVMNRIELSYKAPYYRMYEYVKELEGEILVIPEPGPRAFLYLSTLEHVTIDRMVMTEAEFLNLTVTHDATFFYQEKWPRWETVHEYNFPFMKEVVRNNTQYQVAVIFDTPEAYLYELIRPEPVINEKVILFLSDGRLWRAQRVGEKYVFSSEGEQLVFGDVATLYQEDRLVQYIAFDWVRVNDELITTTNQTRFQIDGYLAVNK